MLAGCGRKAPPRPPRQSEPPVVRDLSKIIKEDRLRLNWSLTADSFRTGGVVAAFNLYRARQKLADGSCPRCPVLFEQIAKISASQTAPQKDQFDSYFYDDTIEKGYRYFYKVTVLMADGRTGNDSNIVEFVY